MKRPSPRKKRKRVIKNRTAADLEIERRRELIDALEHRKRQDKL